MSVTVNTKWLADALISGMETHPIQSTLIVKQNTMKVVTFPFNEESMCIKNTPVDSSSEIMIQISDNVRQFIKNGSLIFKNVTLTATHDKINIQMFNDFQALKYQLPISRTTDIEVPPSPSDTSLEVCDGRGFLNCWHLFKNENVSISCTSGKALICIKGTDQKYTIFSCKNAAKKDASFKCIGSLMRIFNLLEIKNETDSPSNTENMTCPATIFVTFMESGVLAVKCSEDKILIAPK